MSSVNLDGHRFGCLVVCGNVRVNSNGQREWPCSCFCIHGAKACGKVTHVLETDLLDGNVLSCGCNANPEEACE